MSIAKSITQARKEGKVLIHKKELSRLQDLALEIVAKNYLLYPDLKGLSDDWKIKVYDKINVDYPLKTVFPIISNETYWKRACKSHFKSADFCNHGNSWKQCYAENYVQKLLNEFNPENDDFEGLFVYFDLLKLYVFNIDISYYAAGFDVSRILQTFTNLTMLQVKYSPKLISKDKFEYRKIKVLDPIKEEYTKFGMRISDLKNMAIMLKDLNHLMYLTLQGNFLDDEMMKWLVSGLITNHTIRNLDLSNNKITDKGLIKLSSYIMRSRVLTNLDLTFNQISGEGAFAISLIIKENTKLRSLKLRMNKIDDINGRKILKALSKNEHLQFLDLSSNEIASQSAGGLTEALKENKSIKSIDLSNTNFPMTKELMLAIEESPSLINIDLRETKVLDKEIRAIEQVLIKKSIRFSFANKNK